jgi:hypothetical protein
MKTRRTQCSAIAPFGANGRTLVFRSSVAGAAPLTFRVDVGGLVLFRVYLCHAGGAHPGHGTWPLRARKSGSDSDSPGGDSKPLQLSAGLTAGRAPG